jgi:O-antigen/teichoic acid export membrane protein
MAGMVSFAAAGAYQSLQNLVAPIHVLLRAMDTFATPIAAKAYHQSGLPRLSGILKKIYLFSGIPVIGLLILVLIFAPDLLYLLKGDTYLPYADGIYIMAVFYFFLFINRPLQLAFRAINKGKQIFFANILAAVSMFTVGLWLIDRWGLYGAIGGQALNAFIISLVLWIAWRKNVQLVEGRQKRA